jgi:hypothetical protein
MDTEIACMHLHLTNDELLLIIVERVLWDLEVERSGTSSNSTRDIVVGTVTRAEPSSVVSSLSDGYTTQVGAVISSLSRKVKTCDSPDTQHDKPLSSLNSVLIALGITQSLGVNSSCLGNLVLSSVSNEDGLSSPLDNQVLS